MDMMEVLGPNLGKPHTSSFGDGLFEIRAKGKEGIGRSLFCLEVDEEIIILHSFVKKSQKIPKKELEIARKRLRELK
jgi:phage-related protein